MVTIRTMTDRNEDEYFGQLVSLQMLRQRLWQPAGGHVQLDLRERAPVLLAFTGDWHVGHPFCDYERLQEDLDLIGRTPGVYAVGMGDFQNNLKLGHPAATALYEGGLTDPMEQQRMVAWLAKRAAGKWTVMLEGNHPYWDRKTGGVDTFQGLCDTLGGVNLCHGGTAEYLVGEQAYTGVIYHQYGGKTGLRRLLADHAALAPDFCVCGHLHFRELAQATAHASQHETVLIRSGAYVRYDSYAEEKGLHGEHGVPSLLLFPDRHETIPFSGAHFTTALAILSQMRERAA